MGFGNKTRSVALTLIAVLAMVPFAAVADDSSRFELLEGRLLALEDELNSTRAQLATSENLRADHMPAVSDGGGMDGFLSGLEIGGHVTTSYIYNFNNPDTNAGTQPFNQFNVNHNTFEFDGFKLELGKAASEAGSAGFQVDLLFGANNHILCNGAGGDADSNVCVQEAYVSYNMNGTLLQMGKWETLLGAEVIDSAYNNHVQHGILFTWAIPLVHTGLLASGSLGEGVGWAAGVVNGFNNVTDTGDNKGVLGQLSFEDGPLFASIQAFIGSEGLRRSVSSEEIPGVTPLVIVGDNNNRVQIYDLVVNYDLGNGNSLWANVDYGHLEHEFDVVFPLAEDLLANNCLFAADYDEDPQWWGVAGGGKFAINDKASIALRGEWFKDDGGARLCQVVGGPFNDATYVSATATLAYELTENLTARVEFRHDVIDTDPIDTSPFLNSDSGARGREDQNDVGIIEVVYQFD